MTQSNKALGHSSCVSPIEDIIDDIRHGKMVILIDEEDRKNEGDIVIASDFITPQAINFMATHARGLICLTLTPQKCKELNLPLMVPSGNGTQYGTNFTLSIEASSGVTTGISAPDRARTIQVATAKNAKPSDIVQPGHIFPLRAVDGGVLMRAGHTEAGGDLALLAGLSQSSVICEIMNDDGTMSRLDDLIPFAKKHNIKIGTISSLIEYRSQKESIIKLIEQKPLNTLYGCFESRLYIDTVSHKSHMALYKGDIQAHNETLVRVHEPLSFYDFLSIDTNHSWSIHKSLDILSKQGGVLVLLNCEENTQNFIQKYTNQNIQTKKADLRTYGIGAQILKDIGVGKMKLLANPIKIPSMQGYGLEVTGFYQE